jgi:hypothetical protein
MALVSATIVPSDRLAPFWHEGFIDMMKLYQE